VAPPLLAGLVSVIPPPSLRFNPVCLRPTPPPCSTTPQRRNVPYVLPPLPFVRSDVIFLFLGETKRGRCFWFFLFHFMFPELYAYSCCCFIFNLHRCWPDSCWLDTYNLYVPLSFLVKRLTLDEARTQLNSSNYDSILSPTLHVDLDLTGSLKLNLTHAVWWR